MGKISYQEVPKDWGSSKIFLAKEKMEGALEVGIYTCEVGRKLERHDHGGAAEWCHVLSGDAAFDCDGTITNAKPGDLIYLPPGSNHTSYPTGNQALVSMYIVCNDIQ